MRKSVKNRIFKTVTIIVVVTVIIMALYIMANRLGLVEGYDFGGGAYYYVDIPNFEKVLPYDAFEAKLPIWIYVVLFFLWGWRMWK